MGNNISFCYCDCHKTWGAIVPPVCTCTCNSQVKTYQIVTSSGTNYDNDVKKSKDKIDHMENYYKSKVRILEDSITKLQQSREAHSRSNIQIFDYLEELKQANKNINDVLEVYHKEFSKRLEKLESQDKNGYMYQKGEIEAAFDRIKNIENLIDVEKLKQIILDGANLHLTILKFEERMEKLESLSKALTEMYKDVSLKHVKLIDIEMNRKKPHKCPVCNGDGRLYPDKPEVGMVWDVKTNNQVCRPCDGKGIVWG